MNAQQLAASALKFLARAQLAPFERQEFGIVENALQRIAKGELTIGEPPKPEASKGKKK